MANDAQVFLAGYVATDPVYWQNRDGNSKATLRVAYTPRYVDRNSGEWTDSPTSFVTVVCWRKLADNVALCLRKGEPVLVRGRLQVRQWDDREGHPRTRVDVDAQSIGHDLARGVALFQRTRRVSGDTAAETGDTAAEAGVTGAGPIEAGAEPIEVGTEPIEAGAEPIETGAGSSDIGAEATSAEPGQSGGFPAAGSGTTLAHPPTAGNGHTPAGIDPGEGADESDDVLDDGAVAALLAAGTDPQEDEEASAASEGMPEKAAGSRSGKRSSARRARTSDLSMADGAGG